MPKQNGELHIVTGAYGYLGRYITEILLKKGIRVKTLTGHPHRPDPFGGRVEAVPFHFDEPVKLIKDLEGASTIYNTYWVRFNYGRTTFGQAVANVENLFRAAKEAGVKRVVHISITNPDEDCASPYFRGKALMERALIESGLSYAIVRPTVLFGKEDILFNNIAYLLRRLPVFLIPGRGDYRIQPVYVGDVAELAVKTAFSEEDIITDAVGPETYTFEGLVRLIHRAVRSRAVILHCPPSLSYLFASMINPVVRDVLITRDEIRELMNERLVSSRPPTCRVRFSEWLRENGPHYGLEYASEISRHYK